MRKFITLTHTKSTDKIVTMSTNDSPDIPCHQIVNDDHKMLKMGIKTTTEIMVEDIIKSHKGSIKEILAAPGRNGLIFAAGNTFGNTAATSRYEFKTPPNNISNIMMKRVLSSLGEFEYIATDATSCTSGHVALKTASLLIDAGELDRVLIVSADNGISENNIRFFTKYNICDVGDKQNAFKLGQASNFIIVENKNSLQNTKSNISGELLDIRVKSENHNSVLGISDSGDGYRKVVKDQIQEPDAVKVHGTNTEENVIENKVINEFYPNAIKKSYKEKIGHTLGSSPNVEMCLALEEMKCGVLLALSSGMGNVFTSSLIKKEQEQELYEL